jgi:hypothetical protein
MKAFAGVLLILVFLSWGAARGLNNIMFGIDCGGHMKRAADANSVELATEEMRTVVSYLENNGMTSGYTSILYRTPDEDVGFWYKNLKASLGELETTSPQATPLEKSNVLMKLRETLLDEGQSVGVTVPDGISIFPSNTAYMLWSLLGCVMAIVGVILIYLQTED